MFELFTGIYAEKIEGGRYRIFTQDESIVAFVNINRCVSHKLSAKFIRRIARQVSNIQKDIYNNYIERMVVNEK